MPVLYPHAAYAINFFGLYTFNINFNIINLFIPSFLNKSYSEVWSWGWGLITDDDITHTFDFDNNFTYDNMYNMLTGNEWNPFGFFLTPLGVAVDVLTTLGYSGAISTMGSNQWYTDWHDNFGDYFLVYSRQFIKPVVPFIVLLKHYRNQFIVLPHSIFDTFWYYVLGFTPSCDEKIRRVLQKWLKLLLWPVAWVSFALTTAVRLIAMIFVFFEVTFFQFIAITTNFFIEIKNWFDEYMFGWFYWLVNRLWRYIFSIPFAIIVVVLTILAGLWFAVNYVLQIFMALFQWYNGIYWQLFWWFIAEFNPFYEFFGGILYYIWYYWVQIIWGGMDDLCDGIWDTFNDYADAMLADYFIIPQFQPSIFELPFAFPMIFIEIFLS